MPIPHTKPSQAARPLRLVESAILLAALFFFALHFVHLTADFPNHSPWMDWSKYTDEGWYGDAAIRHVQLGHWYVPGDFNPAAALPAWPFLEAILFHFTGVSLAAARTLSVSFFGASLLVSYGLLRRWQPGEPSSNRQFHLPFIPAQPHPSHSLAPAIGVLLLAVSPFCFVFTRLAILEPLLVFLTLLALYAAGAAPPALKADAAGVRRLIAWVPTIALGFLLPAIVLTKTTGLFLFPSIAFLLWAAAGFRLRLFLRVALPSCLLASALWSSYFFFLVRPHFLKDYRYLFSANAYTGITLASALSVVHDTLAGGFWLGNVIYPLALLAVLLTVIRVRYLKSNPLPGALVLWAAGYAAFLAYHNNLQPRYYLVIAVPLTLLVAAVMAPALLWFRKEFHGSQPVARPVLALASTLFLTIAVIPAALQTLNFVRHPEYTLVNAANGLANIVRADKTHSNLLLSISGSDISLITGLPSICDDFGTLELPDRVKLYRPGWYAAWNEIDDDKMDSLTPLFHIERVAAFPAMDDPARNLLILYRLDATIVTPPRKHKPNLPPRSLQTHVGQQPSTSQLEH